MPNKSIIIVDKSILKKYRSHIALVLARIDYGIIPLF